MNEKKYSRKQRRKVPEDLPKTEEERWKTHQEVQQIKKNLISFAKTEWGKEWIHSILKVGRPFRMQRGIEYAEDDQRIENLTINKGQIFATVQGTSPSPYRVKINFDTIPEGIWNIVFEQLTTKPIYLIKMLEGLLPEEISKVFEENNAPLFPDSSEGLNAECSCPDKAIPCKHIAAVILYLSRVIDFDPFILLKLRGKTKQDILNGLKLAGPSEPGKEHKEISLDTKIIEEIELTFDLPKKSIQEVKQELADFNILRDLNKIGFKFKKPGKIIETLENLGNPPSLENKKAFEIVFKAIYQTVMKESYKKAINEQ